MITGDFMVEMMQDAEREMQILRAGIDAVKADPTPEKIALLKMNVDRLEKTNNIMVEILIAFGIDPYKPREDECSGA